MRRCPERYYPVYYDYERKPEAEELSTSLNQCVTCHYTCRDCHGSNDYDCTACFPDALLYRTANSESYCYPRSLVSDVLSEKWYFRVFVLLCAVGTALLGVLLWKCTRREKMTDVMQMDTLKNIRNIERNVKNTVYSDSE